MKDGIITGNGDSRFLKSAIPANITHEELVALLRAGTFPVDLNGINPAAWVQLATALSKATLLTDATAALLELAQADPTVDDALFKLGERAKIKMGSYVGTGTYGESNPCSITVPFAPKIVAMLGQRDSGFWYPYFGTEILNDALATVMSADGLTQNYEQNAGFWYGTRGASFGKKSPDGKTFYWYHNVSNAGQFNATNTEYHWLAIG